MKEFNYFDSDLDAYIDPYSAEYRDLVNKLFDINRRAGLIAGRFRGPDHPTPITKWELLERVRKYLPEEYYTPPPESEDVALATNTGTAFPYDDSPSLGSGQGRGRVVAQNKDTQSKIDSIINNKEWLYGKGYGKLFGLAAPFALAMSRQKKHMMHTKLCLIVEVCIKENYYGLRKKT